MTRGGPSAPGVYWARSVRLETFERKGWRRRIVVRFQVFEHNPLERATTTVLAELPWYATLPDGPRPMIRATSKLGRLLDLLGEADPRQDPTRRPDRVPLGVLRHRLWTVQVDTVRTDTTQRPLQPVQYYSIISAVLRHIA